MTDDEWRLSRLSQEKKINESQHLTITHVVKYWMIQPARHCLTRPRRHPLNIGIVCMPTGIARPL
jgi:hypothetical protein